MDGFDYVKKVFGANNIFNVRPITDILNEDWVTEFVSPSRIVVSSDSPAGNLRAVVTGDFQYSGDTLTGQDLLSLRGTVKTLEFFVNELLEDYEQYPEGTSVNALVYTKTVEQSFAFQKSLLSGNSYFAGSPMREHDKMTDHVQGGDGNDTFFGYGGDDYFYGGGGIDTSIYRGTLSEYAIERSDEIFDTRANDGSMVSGWIVTDRVAHRDDSDRLVDVERLQFSDVTLALDIDGIAAQAYRIYKAAFNREPDKPGLGFWITQMDKGVDLQSVAQSFIGSEEFMLMYGSNPSDESFIDLLYENVLDRSPDQSGYDFWIGALNRGLSRAGALAEFSESVENIRNTDPLIADGILYVPFIQ